jgi:gliding motility-associated-like protein
MPQNNNQVDSFYVNHHDTITLNQYLLPTIIAFISGNDTICSNQDNFASIKVSFTGVTPFTFKYSINGIEQSEITTTSNPYIISTTTAGKYDLVSFSDAVENGNLSGQAFVTISEAPIADFQPEPETTSILYTTIQMIDNSSSNVVSWQWSFGDDSETNNEQNPIHTYPEEVSRYQIFLTVQNDFGCSDSIFKAINITDDYWIYVPNSFTPNFDEINDNFFISYYGIREETFKINIYNRLNELVYSTKNILDLSQDKGWDGKHQTKEIDLPSGTYIYELSYQDLDGWQHYKTDKISIIR